ncbi:MAG: single-stranded-DNA-specific exonuclease RecJ [Alphaproteobacteria bacterium]|nr:single-stranded-DNA-specific exonuclease RecJ [Alphaproteobacteria bacterium]
MSADPGEAPGRPVLGVARSLAGRPWRERPLDLAEAVRLAQRLGVPEIVGRLVAGRRGLDPCPESVLCPSLKGLLPNPSDLRDMDSAAERLADAVARGERIAIFGDYDVDGATSTALLARFLRALGAEPVLYIPDRMAEGYGPNAPAMARLAEAGVSVVVTVDCGTQAHEALAAAKGLGLDVIVCDHHQTAGGLPPAHAVVNPNRPDDGSACGHLAAVGVAFLLAVAVNRCLRGRAFFAGGRAEPELLQLLDLVALGTVCDVVPLVTVNRALVAQGLKVMARWANPGLKALAEVANAEGAPSVYHAGYLLGPRVNAGGRIGRASLGAELLSTDDPAAARERAVALDGYNRERQAIERVILDEALDLCRRRWGDALPPVVTLASASWHPGVVGIVAGRLKERLRRPVIVIGLDGEGPAATGKGSGRSIHGVDLGGAVAEARAEGLLRAGGGHAMAAGLTLAAESLPALEAFLAERLAAPVAAALAGDCLTVDGVLTPRGADGALLAHIERVGPYGAGNPEPVFALPRLRVDWAREVGEGHLQLALADETGARLDAIAFRARGTALGTALADRTGRLFHLAGRLKADRYRGEGRIRLQIEDAAAV